jgi:hypothetical protein
MTFWVVHQPNTHLTVSEIYVGYTGMYYAHPRVTSDKCERIRSIDSKAGGSAHLNEIRGCKIRSAAIKCKGARRYIGWTLRKCGGGVIRPSDFR